LAEGALAAGLPEVKIRRILREEQATDVCLRSGNPGDLIVLLADDVEAVWTQVLAFAFDNVMRAAIRISGLCCGKGKRVEMSQPILIRDPRLSDEIHWRRLWDGYNEFYETSVPPEVTTRTWQRILDPGSSIRGRIAENEGTPVGFSVCVLHDGTWVSGSVCYLEDLFVDPACRGKGIGRKLIKDLIDLAKRQNWSMLYWHTHKDNPARRLYDEFVEADQFVRYRLQL
jgi:GNAT superfamily N-acetyltransferase